MLDIINELKMWDQQGKRFALATVTNTWKSAPRGVGSSMIVDEDGKMAGSVSGGCVEGQVVKAVQEVLLRREAKKLKFGVSDDDAWSVGLSCGGAISVLVQPFFNRTAEERKLWKVFQSSLAEDTGCVLIYGDQSIGFYSSTDRLGSLPIEVYKEAANLLAARKSQTSLVGEREYFFHVFPTSNHLVIIGAAHITRDLIAMAKQQDFKVTVIDPRGLFYDSLIDLVNKEGLIRAWPAEVLPGIKLDDSVFAVLLTHDPKIDDQALHILLDSDVAYIGALGSKRTQEKRVVRLREAGFEQMNIDRIRGPIGLDIAARTPAEIALSIMAEIVKVKNKAFLQ